MPIRVKCDCGHEVTVADAMAGKKGRCPECNGIVSIPGRGRHRGRGGAYGRVPSERRARGYGWLAGVSLLLWVGAFTLFLTFVGMGVYSMVMAFQDPDGFRGPWGLLSSLGGSVQAQPALMAFGLFVGGLAAGCLSFLLLAAISQLLRLFISLEGALWEISEHFSGRD